jgi:hypothetical protein
LKLPLLLLLTLCMHQLSLELNDITTAAAALTNDAPVVAAAAARTAQRA